MFTCAGAYLAEQRRARHLNTHQLAAALGYAAPMAWAGMHTTRVRFDPDHRQQMCCFDGAQVSIIIHIT